MFAVEQEENQFLTYILSDLEAQSQIEVVPSRGGIITTWKIADDDILYLDAARFADQGLSVRGGIPILFPICGNLPNNSYTWGDRTYKLPQHGFARNMPWVVRETHQRENAAITLVLTSDAKTREVYPFDFELAFTYVVKGTTLKILQRYTNLSEEKMPFSSGFHPYFLALDKTQLEFEIPAQEYVDQITTVTHTYQGGFDFKAQELDLAFTSLKGNTSSFADNQRRLRLRLDYSDIFQTLVFWTVYGKDYVCLEPWSAPRNALNTGTQLCYLQPGASCDAVVELNVSYF